MQITCENTSSTQSPAQACPRVRVMIVEDSLVIREFLTNIISRDPRLKIAAVAVSGEDALSKMDVAAPDVISMDIRLPGMDGFETTRRIMAERPTPIVVVAANAEVDDSRICMNAMRAGALSVLEKPNSGTSQALEAFTERLCTQLAIMSQVKVITQRNGNNQKTPAIKINAPLRRATAHYEMVGIVSSTGGPNALVQILGALGPDFPVPILLVQHITSCFSNAFREWLDDICELRVVEAAHGEHPRPGCVYLSPPDRHLTVHRKRLWLNDGPLICMQRPSGTMLLRSMAEDGGSAAVGVVLTGMGDDGAVGLQAIRAANGYTIAEHESTAIVYGMPAAAVAMGAACEALPLPQIASRLCQLVGR